MARSKSLTEDTGTLGALLRAPFEAMLSHNWSRVRELGFDDIRMAHGAVFRHISSEGSRITELAARAGMTKQSMAELVAYLRVQGYVDLTPDPEDRRGRLVQLNESGRAVFQALADASSGFEAECAGLIGPEKWAQFKDLLTELAAALEPAGQNKAPTS